MICPTCQNESTVHIFDPAQGAMTYYCQSCRRAIVPETSMRCPGCNTSEHQFLTTGLCGCEDCYSVFRNSIIQGIESYRKEVFTRTGRFRLPGGAALARLQTYFEIKKSDATDRQPESVAEPWPESLMQPDPVRNIEALELKSGEVQFRIRMARNIPGLPYRADEHSQFLEDVFLSPKGFLSDIWPGSSDAMQTAATIGDEDHFRFSWSWITDGEMRAAESRVAAVLRQIRALDQAFVWQYSTVFGYLTGCPTNSGSGIRLSARMAIPELLADPSWLRWKKELHRAGFEVRPGGGEKSFPDGRYIQLVTRRVPDYNFRPLLERFRVYIGRLMIREERIGQKNAAMATELA